MLSRSLFRRCLGAVLVAAFSLAGCSGMYGLDEYEITDDTRCGDALVDLSSNREHCGECDNECGSRESCLNGICVCEQGTDACDGACVDLDTNADHCGACNTACPGDASCQNGNCRCDDSDLDLCSGECVDLNADSDHCGGCGEVCAPAASCDEGVCECDNDAPEVCDDRCVDTMTDEAHCGACGEACATGASCNSGNCECDVAAQEVCGDRCVDLATDEDNCGGCGDLCPAGATCTASTCVCPTGTTVCSGACVNLSTDEDHCGACNNACDVPNATSVCQLGTCGGDACNDGYDDCNNDLFAGESGNGCEIETNSNEMHCGACNVACDPGDTCNAGSCSCEITTVDGGECSPSGCGCDAGEGCYYNTTDLYWTCNVAGLVPEGGACDGNFDCRPGFSCVDNVCRPYCGQGQPCSGDCSPVYLDGAPVDDWNYCHAVCNPVPTSTLSQDPPCASGQKCAVLFSSGSTVCNPMTSPGGMAARCAGNEECQSGYYCNNAGYCQASCWMEADTCNQLAFGYSCRGYIEDVFIDENELGSCLPTEADSGCKEACTTDADCMVIGTVCTDTTSGRICLNEQCQECFDDDLSCNSDPDDCFFMECTI